MRTFPANGRSGCRPSSSEVIPRDREAEAEVLARLLLDANARLEGGPLSADCFDDPRHRALYQAIEVLAEENPVVTPAMVAGWLRDRGRLEEAGGEAYLRHLSALAPGTDDYAHHAARVREVWLRRRVWLAARDAALAAADMTRPVHDSIALLEEAAARTGEEALSGAVPLAEAVERRWLELTSPEAAEEGVATGQPELDRLGVRLRPGELVVVAGRPSQGKTQFALNLAVKAARAGAPVWFFSLETSARALADRFMAMEMRLPAREIRARAARDPHWTLEQGERVARLKALPVWIVDRPGLTTAEIAAWCRRARRTTGLGLLVVDYLTLLADPRPASWSRDEHVGAMASRLQDLARRLDVCVVCLSQLSRAVEHRADKRPTMADLRESGVIEQAAHVVLLLHRPEVHDPRPENQNLLVVEVAKHKDGPTGTVRLMFLKEHGGRIESCAGDRGLPVVAPEMVF